MPTWINAFVVYLASQMGIVTTLETQWEAITTATTWKDRWAAIKTFSATLFDAIGNAPIETLAAPEAHVLGAAHDTIKAGTRNWAGLFAFIMQILPVILPFFKPTPTPAP